MAKRFSDASSVLPDMIRRSQLISDGPPAQYRLLTTRTDLNEDGSVRKWTFGERDNKTQNKVILLVGETGTGKTTLINTMVNYLIGVKFTDEVWFCITEEDQSDQSKSQTTQITMYEVFVKGNPTSLTIIDTPGYGDTRGRENDEKIGTNLYTLLYNNTAMKEVDAVGLVLKASENRISDRFIYIFDSILSLFSKNIEKNIVVFFTHSSGSSPRNAINAVKKAKIPCRKNKDNNPEHFLFDNCQTDERSPEDEEELQRSWRKAEESLECFLSTLREENRISLEQTKDVLLQRIRLSACVTNLQERVDYTEKTQETLKQIQKVIEENQENIKRNKTFTFTVTKYYKERVEIKQDTIGRKWFSWLPLSSCNIRATTCKVCKENCHDEYSCYLALSAAFCQVMKDDHCTVCRNKCHYNKHIKENMKYVTSSKTIQKTFEDLEREYETKHDAGEELKFDSGAFKNVAEQLKGNKEQKKEKLNIKKEVEDDLCRIEKEKRELVEEANSTIIRLCAIALKPDSALIVQALDFLIPRAEEMRNHVIADKLKELRRIDPESEERANVALSYLKLQFNKLRFK